MDVKAKIIAASERVFDQHGFTAAGVDQLTQAANVSSRTLYKHLGGKSALVVATLERRSERFFEFLDVDSVDALFLALSAWTEAEGARGCYFLRALADAGGDLPEVRNAVEAYRTKLCGLIKGLVMSETSTIQHADTIQVLFEGAVATASYFGPEAIDTARRAAGIVLNSTEPKVA